MKTISNALSARLSGETVTLCLCWLLQRQDGFVLGLTDHDRPLSVNGTTYEPGAAIDAGKFVQDAGLNPGRAAAGGVLSNDAITDVDLSAGLWDGARVDVFRVDWKAPELGRISVWSGYLSELSRGERGDFEAELVSLKADLERPVGRVMQRRCSDPLCEFCSSDDGTGSLINCRGFPHMPGIDFVLGGPAADGNDGGKR
ncbi:MAG: DUF2163 domain-containing protein [Pseudomonadota bacterium]